MFQSSKFIATLAVLLCFSFAGQAETIQHRSHEPTEGLSLLEKGLGCTLPESQQEGGLSVGAVGPQGASPWRDYPRRSVRARSFAP